MNIAFPVKSLLVLATACGLACGAWARPAGATKLVISGVPGIVYTGGNPGVVTVTAETATNAVASNSTAAIELMVTGPAGFISTLTADAVAGVATLNTGLLALANGAYTLTASGSGLTSAVAHLTVMASSAVLPSTAVGSSAAAQTITFGFASATIVSGVQVLFEGVPNLDFTAAGGSACVGHQVAAGTCTVPVVFTPRAAGMRLGAVELTGAGGAVLQTILVSGVGLGAEVNFAPSRQRSLGAGLGYPDGLAFDGNGNLYIADYPADDGTGRVVKVPLVGGVLSTAKQVNVGSGLNYVDGLAFDGAGNLYVSDYDENKVIEVPANGGPNVVVLQNTGDNTDSLYNPAGLTVDGAGNLYICDYVNNRVIEIPSQNGHLNNAATIYLGNGLEAPSGIKVDAAGNLIIAEWGHGRVLEIPNQNGALNSAAQTTLVSDQDGQPADVALDAAGNLYVVMEDTNLVEVVPNQNGAYNPAAAYLLASGLNGPDSVALDNVGNVYFCDTYDGLVYELDTVDPPALTFPNTGIGQISAPQTVPVLSSGNQPLSLNLISFAPSFPNQGSTCTGTLASGLSCNVLAGFAPTALGATSAAASLADNAVNQASPTQSVTMSGTGVQGPQTIQLAATAVATYGDSPVTLSASGGGSGNPVVFTLVGGPAALAGGVLTLAGAGTVVVKADQAGNALYLPAPEVTQTITVAPALLTVTAVSASVVYGSALPKLSYLITGFVHGDSAAVVAGVPVLTTTATAASPVGSYPIAVATTGMSAKNYVFAGVPGAITITPAALVVSVKAGPNLTYGQPLGSGLSTTSSMPGWWSFTANGNPATSASVLGAGSYVVVGIFTPTSTTDYAPVVQTLPNLLTVAPASLAVTANDASMTAGGAVPSLEYGISGFVAGDTQTTAVTGAPVETTTATSASPAGAYPINILIGTLAAANYTFTFVNGTLTVTAPAALPYSAQTKIAHDFNQRRLTAGSTLWFDGSFDASGTQDGTILAFQNATIRFSVNGRQYNVAVPSAMITFSASATSASTHFDATTQTWNTIAPLPQAGERGGWWGDSRWGNGWGDCGWGGGASCNLFLDGVALPVPAGGLPGNIEDASWSGTLRSNNPSLVVHWQWSAASYSVWNSNYNALGILAAAPSPPLRGTSDPAGTPESYQKYETAAGIAGGWDWDDGPSMATVRFNNGEKHSPSANPGWSWPGGQGQGTAGNASVFQWW